MIETAQCLTKETLRPETESDTLKPQRRCHWDFQGLRCPPGASQSRRKTSRLVADRHCQSRRSLLIGPREKNSAIRFETARSEQLTGGTKLDVTQEQMLRSTHWRDQGLCSSLLRLQRSGEEEKTRWGQEAFSDCLPSLAHIPFPLPTPTSSNSTFENFEQALFIILSAGMQCIPTTFIGTQYRA